MMKSNLRSGVSTAALVFVLGAAPALAQSGQDDEIIVTARKRVESLQDVPLSVQALGQDDIAKGGLKSIADYALRIPSLSFSQFLPGQSIIVFRGATTTAESFNGTSSSALYLDEIPMQLEGQNPEIWLVDIERLEAVSGPQPTTYGASSQSGTLKYVTVQPDLGEFGGFVDVGGTVTENGDPSYDLSGAINIPLVKDVLALRVAGWHADYGGYIDNIAGDSSQTHSFPAPGDSDAIDEIFGPGASNITRNFLSNDAFVEDDIGGYDISGVRASLKWQVNENWTATAMYQWQDTNSSGVAAYNPDIGDLQTVRFNEEFTDDEWYASLLKIEGDLGFADLTSSTTYFERDYFYQWDASSYWSPFLASTGLQQNAEFARGDTAYLFAAYQSAITAVTANANSYYVATEYSDASLVSLFDTETTRFSQEVRLTSKPESEILWMAGGYYERFTDVFDFRSLTDGWSNSLAATLNAYYGTTINEPGIQYNGVADDVIEQWAVFAELGFGITDRLSVLGGARYYDIDQTNNYLTVVNDGNFAFTCTFNDPDDETSGCQTDGAGNLLPRQATAPDDGFVTLATLTYAATDDVLAYFTRSSGFRTGGGNILRPGSTAPPRYNSDKLVNYEVGLKTTMLDDKLTLNLSAYHMVWRDLQINANDPTLDFGFGSIILNAGRAVIQGVEANWNYAISESLTFDGSAAYINARSVEDVTLNTPFGPETLLFEDEELPLSPDWKFNFGLEKTFELPFWDAEAYARFDYTYVGEQFNGSTGSLLLTGNLAPVPRVQPSYDIGSLGFGITRDDLQIYFSINNLWDERPVYFNPPRWPDNRVYTARPREYTLSISKSF